VVATAARRESLLELADDAWVVRLVDAWDRRDPARVDPHLPGVGRRDHHVASDELAPVHVVAERRGEEPDAVATLLEEAIRLLEHRHPRPFEDAGIDEHPLLLRNLLHPVVQPAHHDGADRPHLRDAFALFLPPLPTALH